MTGVLENTFVINKIAMHSNGGGQNSGSMDLGTGTNRFLVCLSMTFVGQGSSDVALPKVAGDLLTQVAGLHNVSNIGGWDTFKLCYYNGALPAGSQSLLGYQNSYGGYQTDFWLVLKYINSTPLGTFEDTIEGAGVNNQACVDARVGNLILGGVCEYNNSETKTYSMVTVTGSGQENILNVNEGKGYASMDLKLSTGPTDGPSWSVADNRSLIVFAIPLYISTYVPKVTVL